MLAVKPGQYDQMRDYALSQYVERTLAQFRRHFPRHVQIIGDEPMRAMIRLGVERAEKYGFVSERDATLYASLMLLFGSYFDEDPQCGWAVESIAENPLAPPANRALALYDRGVLEWEELAGADNLELVKAMRRAKNLSFDELAHSGRAQVERLLSEIHPRKAERLGKTGFASIHLCVERAAEQSGERNSAAVHGPIAALFFAFGTGALRDPMFPWVGRGATGAGSRRDTIATMRTVYDGAMSYFDAWLAHVPESR